MVHTEFMSKKELKKYNETLAFIDKMNNDFKVGQEVLIIKDDGYHERDVITSPFTYMCGNAVAWLKVNRCYLAERIALDPF